MPAWLERLGVFASAPDARPAAEIAADIDAELAFHLEERARELEAEGWDHGAARAEAESRFGDVHRVRRECARVQLGERIMLQRVQVVLTAGLLVAVVVLGLSSWRAGAEARAQRDVSQQLLERLQVLQAEKLVGSQAPAPEAGGALQLVPQITTLGGALPTGEYLLPDGRATTRPVAAAVWRALFAEDAQGWRHGLEVAERLAALPGSQGAEILLEVLPELPAAQREQVAKPFVLDGGKPDALRLLAALADSREPETSVRERAFLDLQTYAWQDLFVGDTTYDDWMARWRDEPVADVLRANATRWAGQVHDALAPGQDEEPCAALAGLLEVVDRVRPETFAGAGLDLAAILTAAIGEPTHLENSAAGCDSATRQRAARVAAWCRGEEDR